MIIDSSAIVAVVIGEPGHERVVAALDRPDRLGAGAPTLFESGLVLCARFGSRGRDMLRSFVRDSELQPIPFADHHSEIAIHAFLHYGKDRHPARLNLGDCMSYAVARWADEPLLCVGEDFAKTDLALVDV